MLTLLLAISTLGAVWGSAIPLLSSAVAHTFTGHGGLSAGASSRLFADYPPAIQSDIMDFLFLPQWGLGLQIFKAEIGGGVQSTDGSEPTHEAFRGDLSCTRGFELTLMKGAKARNPDIKLYGLSWGAPGWLNNGTFFGPDMVQYQTAWVKCMQQQGLAIDYLGSWNERFWGGAEYIKSLRAALDAEGFSATQIIIPDGGYDPAIMAAAAADPAFNASFSGVGLHYPCDKAAPEVQAGGKLYWASEDWWSQPTESGAAAWGHLLVQNYVVMNMTTTIAWSPLWSVYDGLPYEQAGLLLAAEPWSGHWEVSPPVWAGAQWTQFTSPGWRFLSVPSGGSGQLPLGGYYVSLVPPEGAGRGLTVILETLDSPRCRAASQPSSVQSVTFNVSAGAPLPLPGTRLSVWQSNATSKFVRLGEVVVAADGTFTVDIAPGAMVTVSTVAGATKGVPRAAIPPSAPFPFPYSDDFSGYAEDSLARYMADQFGEWPEGGLCKGLSASPTLTHTATPTPSPLTHAHTGSFAVRGGRLVQTVPASPGKNAWLSDPDPFTLLGSSAWTDYTVSLTALFPPAPPPAPSTPTTPLADGAPAMLRPCSASDPAQQWVWDSPAPGYLSNSQPGGAGRQCLNVYGCKSQVVYWSCLTTGGTCCGASCYQGLIWRHNASSSSSSPAGGGGQLVSALPGGGCVTVAQPVSTASTLTLQPCGATSGQSFAYATSSGLVEVVGSGLCLSQPPPPPPPLHYVQLCGRLGSFNGFSAGAPISAYCLRLAGDGSWVLQAGQRVLAQGVLPAPLPVPGSELGMSLSFKGGGWWLGLAARHCAA